MKGTSTHDRVATTVWDWRRTEAEAARRAARAVSAARRQGVVRAAVGLAAAGLVYLLWKPAAAYVVATVALALLAVALLSPRYLAPRLDAALAAFARAVGTAMTWVFLPLIYLLVFLPLGAVLRRGRLRFVRRPQRDLPSYWVTRQPLQPSADDYRRQF